MREKCGAFLSQIEKIQKYVPFFVRDKGNEEKLSHKKIPRIYEGL